MSLRLDGGDEIDKSIGTVLYSSKDNAITAIKGDTDKDVSLIIQCKVDGTDKYISERITDGYIAKLDKDSGYDVSQCKIWLEIPVDDGSTLAYAVEATEHDHTLGDKPEKFDEQWHGYKCIDEECPVPGGYFENLEEHIWGEDNLCDICEEIISHIK